jgi:TIR domain
MRYDLAFSFAGEQREYVEATKVACEKLGLHVFYDRDKSNEWWGRSFIREQRVVYGSQTRFFVPFISTEYLTKPIPTDEFSAAMMTAVKLGDGYILPVLVGDVSIPPDLLHPHIHYLRADDFTPERLAEQLQRRVHGAESQGQEAREVSLVVKKALEVRLPKVVPTTFSRYRELQVVFDYLATQFEAALPQLESSGFVGTLGRQAERLSIRIEHRDETVYSLDVYKGGSLGDDKLTFGLDHHRGFSNGINGWAEPFFDKEADAPKLRMTDFSVLGRFGGGDAQMTKEELFNKIWDRIIDQLEVNGRR